MVDAGRIKHFVDPGDGTLLCLLSVKRVRYLLERYPPAKSRLFTSHEAAYRERHKRNPWQHFAARWAAKLCYRRLYSHVPFLALEVFHSEYGAPQLRGVGEVYSIQPVLVSLSHDGDLAGAVMSGGCLR